MIYEIKKNILLATYNKGKIAEFQASFSNSFINFTTLKEVNFNGKIDETGSTYAENALIKAKSINTLCSLPTLSEDSGIEIDKLKGQLGIHSARYGGNKSSHEVNKQILGLLKGVRAEDRLCRYISVIAFVDPINKVEELFYGECKGIVHTVEKGLNGFGFDPIFYLPERNLTMGELSTDEKNQISHRAKAIFLFKKWFFANYKV
ncbi:MAG: RdgB/HAM1 family non-canonical purine NTP pyrophosphatase [Nitrospinota bacterium]